MPIVVLFLSSFIVMIVAFLMLDLLVIGKKSHVVSLREAAIWSGVWIVLSLTFALFLRYFAEWVHGIQDFDHLREIVRHYNPYLELDPDSFERSLEIFRKETTLNYLSGYLIEKTLSVDNLFVIMAILSSFSVKKINYKSVLFWGILGAIVMRMIFIFVGAELIYRFEWLLYFLGVYLLYAGVKMYIERNKKISIEPQNHRFVKFLSRNFNVFPRYVDGKFFIRRKGLLYITPLFIVLLFIEFTDVLFAIDSIPAIFAITYDPYIVFFSNIFAILGLRSLFFLLVKVEEKFYLLKTGVAFLLVYVGMKLFLHDWLHTIGFKPSYSLFVILAVIVLSIALSVIFPRREVNSM
ncbi:MAG: TerC/Alx family metal homeostasis membrane protein [Bacteroidales bacterium]|nr:TerC/Alx family metal homeostasis membrane protein [Bacteroidales bacterium]